MIAQQTKRLADRALKVPETQNNPNDLPNAGSGKKLLGIDNGTITWEDNRQPPGSPSSPGPFVLQSNGNGGGSFWNTVPNLQVDASTLAVLKQFPAGVSQIVYLSTRTDGNPGNGTMVDPYDVSTPLKWRTVIRSLPNFTTIMLLPGVYSIRGESWGDISQEGRVFPVGCSIIGSGINNTTIRVTDPPATGNGYTAIVLLGSNASSPTSTVSNCVVSDLTIDCNWQTLRTPNAKSGAVYITGGSNNAIKRVRCINFGGDSNNGQEAFPMSCGGLNALVEECVVEQPVVGINPNNSLQAQTYATYISVGIVEGNIQGQTVSSLTVNNTTNTFSHSFPLPVETGDSIIFTAISGGSDLTINRTYYVVNPTNGGFTFQVASTANGSPIDFAGIISATGGTIKTLGNAVVRNNICRGLSATNRMGFGVIASGSSQAVSIENNRFENLTYGVYGDSFASGVLNIRHNVFVNCQRNIAVSMFINGPKPLVEEVCITHNYFIGKGIHGSSNSTNGNFLGGWTARIENVRKVVFAHNYTDIADNLQIQEVTPYIDGAAMAVMESNIFHSKGTQGNIGFVNKWQIANNADERGLPRYDYMRYLPELVVDGGLGHVERFTTSNNYIIVNYLATHAFAEGDAVYLFDLQNGSGLSANTKYYLRNVQLTTIGLPRLRGQLYTTLTGGSPVTIASNYGGTSKISNREYCNGVAFERAFDEAISAQPNRKALSNDHRFVVRLRPSTYDHSYGARQWPQYVNWIGSSDKTTTIVRCWSSITVGRPNNALIKNITISGWGNGGIAYSGFETTGVVLEDVIFEQGAGGKVVGAGAVGFRCHKLVRCTSEHPIYDVALNQGPTIASEIVDCDLSGGVGPTAPGTVFRSCKVTVLDNNFEIGNGALISCEIIGAGGPRRIVVNGGRIERSTIKLMSVEAGTLGATLLNSIIEAPTSQSASLLSFTASTPVTIGGVFSNKPIDATNLTVTNLLQL